MKEAHNYPIHLIVAVDEAGGFAKQGKIPWNIPEDMKHFQETTKGGACIMGRGSYDDMVQMKRDRTTEIPGVEVVVADDEKPILPGRQSFVVTSDVEKLTPGATTCSSITDAMTKLPNDFDGDVFVLGGKRLFIEALGRQAIVHMTIIKGDTFGCTQFFPFEALNRSYKIVDGRETDACYYVTYHPTAVTQRDQRNETNGNQKRYATRVR